MRFLLALCVLGSLSALAQEPSKEPKFDVKELQGTKNTFALGKWSRCLTPDDIAVEIFGGTPEISKAVKSVKLLVEYTEDSREILEVSHYLEEGCQEKKYLRQITESQVVAAGDLDGKVAGQKTNRRFVSAQLAIADEKMAEAMTKANFLNHKWEVDKAYDVTKLTENRTPPMTNLQYVGFQLDADKLLLPVLSQAQDSTSEKTRPTTFNKNLPLTKEK